jgi:catechol 2,3-dioxygenase-like lactoylglutathione lyase family enzyme/DNA-binding transcriptional ArsR family regulator
MVSTPAFVRLAAHPLRWRLLTELAAGDYRVRELRALLDQPQNLVSYHLRLLRDGGLVTARRSSFDGRDSYYHLDLERCAHALAAAGGALHPALRPEPPGMPSGRPRVLFACTGNSARSPIAEALLRLRTGGHAEVTSGGSRPKAALHPHAVRVLAEHYGIDVTGQLPRHLDAVRPRAHLVRQGPGGLPRVHRRATAAPLEHSRPRRRGGLPRLRAHRPGDRHPDPLPAASAHHHPIGGSTMTAPDQLAGVRYLVDDVQAAMGFYTTHLGFTVGTDAAPAFADVVRGPLRLLLSGPASSGARATPDTDAATPGRNRIHLIVDDLAAEIDRLRAAGLSFRSELVSGPGGRQILIADPAGNLVELFEPAPRPG